MSVNRKVANPLEIYAPKDVRIPSRLGGGLLRERVVREAISKQVVRYTLAYINPKICGKDNGRVLGYDNSHGYSHRHFMGTATDFPFHNYEELYERFEQEWQALAINFVNGSHR